MYPVIGGITFVILMCLVMGHKCFIYEWLDKVVVAKDPVLNGKKGFLNPTFFTIWTTLTIGLWTVLGYKMRKISRELDDHDPTIEEGKKYIFKNTVWAGLVYCLVCPDSCVYYSLAMADEYQCALVQYHVQLVHFCQHICSGCCTDDAFCYLSEK